MAQRLLSDGASVVHGHNIAVHHFAAVAKQIARVPVCLNTRHSVTTATGAPYEERYFRRVQPITEHVVFVCDYVERHLEPLVNYPLGDFQTASRSRSSGRGRSLPAPPGRASTSGRSGAWVWPPPCFQRASQLTA